MKNAQDLSFKVNTHYSSKSKNDRAHHGDSVDRKLDRRARAQFRNLKVSLANSDWN